MDTVSSATVTLIMGHLSSFRRSVDDLAARTCLTRGEVISALMMIHDTGCLREARPKIQIDLNDFGQLCSLKLYSLR